MVANAQHAPSARDRTAMPGAPRFPIPPGSLAAVAASPPSDAIGSLWQKRCALEAIATEGDLVDQVCAIEVAVLNSAETGARIAEMRLWIALSHHSEVPTNLAAAVGAADLSPLRAAFCNLDWDVKAIVTAIAALRGEVVSG